MRVVITGMGAVTPMGRGVPVFWDALLRGVCGMRELTRFDLTDFPFTRGGEVDLATLPPLPPGPPIDLATHFAALAVEEAMQGAGLADANPSPSDTALVLATNFGGAASVEALLAAVAASTACPPGAFQAYDFQAAADYVAARWHLRGARTVLSLSCASGAAALGYGAGLIRAGRAKIVVTGGYDALSRFAWSGLGALRTMVKDAVRPFDRDRAGTMFSEGAGVLIIEEAEHAAHRGAPVLAELCGYGLNNNAYHMTAPAKRGAGTAAVMRLALVDAGLPPEAIDHINTHGTGTKPNDVTETEAIKDVFGAHAAQIPLTAIKSSTGHLMGAAGAVEAIASVLTIRDGVIPPTTNLRNRDPACDLDVVFDVKRPAAVRTVLSNSAGIGGCNAAVIVRQVP